MMGTPQVTEATQAAEATEATGIEIQRYGFGTTLDLPIDEAVEKVTAALKAEGFGVLTTIDVQQTLQQKLDIDFEPYYILGACNPRLAHRALETMHDIGLLLPCNVIVHAHGTHGEQTRVEMLDPIAMLGIVQNEELQSVAQEARARLMSALQRLGPEYNGPVNLDGQIGSVKVDSGHEDETSLYGRIQG